MALPASIVDELRAVDAKLTECQESLDVVEARAKRHSVPERFRPVLARKSAQIGHLQEDLRELVSEAKREEEERQREAQAKRGQASPAKGQAVGMDAQAWGEMP